MFPIIWWGLCRRTDRENNMSEKRLSNTIFLMYLVTESYCKKHGLSRDDFLKLDEKYDILSYVSDCPDVFDSMTEEEMVEEIEEYVSV